MVVLAGRVDTARSARLFLNAVRERKVASPTLGGAAAELKEGRPEALLALAGDDDGDLDADPDAARRTVAEFWATRLRTAFSRTHRLRTTSTGAARRDSSTQRAGRSTRGPRPTRRSPGRTTRWKHSKRGWTITPYSATWSCHPSSRRPDSGCADSLVGSPRAGQQGHLHPSRRVRRRRQRRIDLQASIRGPLGGRDRDAKLPGRRTCVRQTDAFNGRQTCWPSLGPGACRGPRSRRSWRATAGSSAGCSSPRVMARP